MAERLRRIAVDGYRFRWRFDGRLVVIPEGRSGPQLYVEWGWRDWLEPEGTGRSPSIVTPRFVADAIRFALSHGWDCALVDRPLLIRFENGCFRLRSQFCRNGPPKSGSSEVPCDRIRT